MDTRTLTQQEPFAFSDLGLQDGFISGLSNLATHSSTSDLEDILKEVSLLFADSTLEDVLEPPSSIVSSLIRDLPSLDETFLEALDSSLELSLMRV